MAKVTIEDVSRATGLSRGTVSRALNDRPDISPQTRQRVLDTCRKLKYVPSQAARSLATGRTYAIAVVVDDLCSAFAAAVLRGVLTRAERERYIVHVVELGAEVRRAAERLRSLSGEQRIDSALIAAPLESPCVEIVRDVLNVRALVACWSLPGVRCDVLAPDQAESGRLVARHLLQGGPRNVLYLHTPGRPGAEERLEGFCEVGRARGLDLDAAVVRVPAEERLGATGLGAVRPHLDRVRAIAAADDFLAIDVMLLSAQAGRRPGQDIAVVGQGNEHVAARIWPTLSTVDFNGEEIGRRAVEVALGRIDGTRKDAPQTVEVAPRLVLRETG
jgi:LacI family transcriptional regulator